MISHEADRLLAQYHRWRAIVGEASDNEAETKLLKTYNSTEFGVPSAKAPPPKYAWLGAAGVASELPSGVIAKDGVTYVPQTGQPLQTQPVELPLPTNSDNPYVKEDADGAEWGAIAGALRVSEYWQAQRATGASEGGTPYGGEEALAGTCANGGACTASYTTCTLHWLFGEPEGGVLAEAVGVRCTRAVASIRYEACFWSWLDHGSDENNKDYHQFSCSTGTKTNSARGGLINQTFCAEAQEYKAWVWGEARSSGFSFEGGGKVSPAWQCGTGGVSGEFEEFAEVAGEKAPEL